MSAIYVTSFSFRTQLTAFGTASCFDSSLFRNVTVPPGSTGGSTTQKQLSILFS